jgi:predicted enzyme related to lactoylglutathione lyase
MFTSLKGVTYQVADLEQAKHWYRKILNQEPVLDSPFFVIFLIGDSVLTLVLTPNPSPRNDERVTVYWGVADIDAVYQRLLEFGATPHTEIRTVVNWRIATVIDPFGNILGIMGTASDTRKRSVENQPSETAMTVAFCRAFAATDEREELRGPDYLAEIFLTEDGKRPLRDRTLREWVRKKLFTPGMYEYFFARTAYLDHIFVQALREHIPQIVFLGAGYDTRSYRFQELIKETRIFELDIEPTQKRKREVLQQANILIPEQLTFVSINFKTDTLKDVLLQAGLIPINTLFLSGKG